MNTTNTANIDNPALAEELRGILNTCQTVGENFTLSAEFCEKNGCNINATLLDYFILKDFCSAKIFCESSLTKKIVKVIEIHAHLNTVKKIWQFGKEMISFNTKTFNLLKNL